ncbi:MAG: hypothetical protein EOP18_00150 [Rhizobiaceae bacterium]|nr:MAG: hypothetical protein EOP18_00150 [Rhizobiaceae bacterium]
MDGWPPVNTRRFDGESERSFRWRAARITEIIETFRTGRYDATVGEELERELMTLQTPSHRELLLN